MPTSATDIFECPVNPATGLPYNRQLTVELYCSNAPGDSLSNITLQETAPCEYLIQAKTASACGASPPPPVCYDDYQCIYHTLDESWDLRPLCSTSATAYAAQKLNPDGTPASTDVIFFNICGNLQTACAPQDIDGDVAPMYSRGTAIQFFEPSCFLPTPPPGCPAPGSLCKDVFTGGQVPCTGYCDVVSLPWLPMFTSVTGGVDSICPGCAGLNLQYPPVPSSTRDIYECPINPVRSNVNDFQIYFFFTPTRFRKQICLTYASSISSYSATQMHWAALAKSCVFLLRRADSFFCLPPLTRRSRSP